VQFDRVGANGNSPLLYLITLETAVDTTLSNRLLAKVKKSSFLVKKTSIFLAFASCLLPLASCLLPDFRKKSNDVFVLDALKRPLTSCQPSMAGRLCGEGGCVSISSEGNSRLRG
jgi:hypothetical protein